MCILISCQGHVLGTPPWHMRMNLDVIWIARVVMTLITLEQWFSNSSTSRSMETSDEDGKPCKSDTRLFVVAF